MAWTRQTQLQTAVQSQLLYPDGRADTTLASVPLAIQNQLANLFTPADHLVDRWPGPPVRLSSSLVAR